MLGGHVRGARGDKRLLGGEHVECGALADTGLLAYAIQGDLGGCDLSICSENLRLRRFKLAPGGHDQRLNRIARGLEVDPLLTNGLLGLAYSRIFRAALVERYADLSLNEGVELLQLGREIGFPAIVDGGNELRGRIERALIDPDLQHGGVD